MSARMTNARWSDGNPAPAGWEGLRVDVVREETSNWRLQPLEDRPDGHGRTPFRWPKGYVDVVSDEPPPEDLDYVYQSLGITNPEETC